MNNISDRLIRAGFVVGLTVAAWQMVGRQELASPNRKSWPDSSDSVVSFNMDRSFSAEPWYGRYRAIMDATVESTVENSPKNTRFIVNRVDDKVSTHYDGHPSEPKDLWPCQDQFLKPKAKQRNTRIDLLLKHINDVQIPRLTEKRIGIALIWDGGANGATLKPQIQKLAKNPRVRAVWITGLDGELRPDVERVFAPLGAKRLILSGQSDYADGLRRFTAQLHQETPNKTTDEEREN